MRNIFSFLCLIYLCNNLYSQVDYEKKFNETLYNKEVDGNINSIERFSLSNNVLTFMELGYFINANTILGLGENNDDVINNIISIGKDNEGTSYKWVVTNVSSSSGNFSMKGKEFIIYEGYLFRYIAQYQYSESNNKVKDSNLVKKNFLKWYNKSGNGSTLYGIRLHMGSHWATVASYLTKLDPENAKMYNSFIEEYDKQLKKSLKVVNINGHECYVWNSTYEDKFTSILKKRKKESVVQDVSHGNHIVQYVIDSYNLGSDSWSKKDLERFSNTLKCIIWKNNEKPSDLVDGTISKVKGISGMGWKQSDGWMKLMVVLNDKELFKIYDDFYKKNSSKVDKFYPNLQYFANMAIYQKNNK